MNSAGSILSNLQKKGLVPMLAQNSTIAPLKIGIFGEQGTGKTFTAALLAAAVSKQFHNGAPVWITDPELGWKFPKRRIFQAEGIEVVQRTVPTFKAMLDDLHAAEKSGACAYAVELAKPWMDLLRTVKKNCGEQWGQELVTLWDVWVSAFINSPLHCFALTRVSDITEDVLNDEDQIRRVKVDEGMKAGGQRNNFGYEPDLVLRMSREIQPRRRKGKVLVDEGRIVHRCYVLKDRASEINGLCFRWPDRNGYKPGGYARVWKDIAPHFAELQECERVLLDTTATSEALLDKGRSEYSRDKQDRDIALEKFDAFLTLLYPGQTGDEKRRRQIITFEITNTLSRTELEKTVFTKRLQWSADVMAALAERIKGGGEFPSTDEQLKAMVKLAKEDVANPANKDVSLLQDQLKKTAERVVIQGGRLMVNGGQK